MRKLPRPAHSARDVFTLCIKQVRKLELRQRLAAITNDIEQGETDYIQNADAAVLYTFPRRRVVGAVSKVELVKVYTGRLVPKNCEARYVYDEIILAAPQGRCPLCGVGQVTTLDHHLPKADYPLLAVTPANLVPACTWCQVEKREGYPATAEEQTLHPYFDDFEGNRWLFADVLQTQPASFSFFVQQPTDLTDLDTARLQNHLETFKLYRLFASNAADELTNIRYSLQNLLDIGGMTAVRNHLSAEADSREQAHKNSWQTAMYRAASDSDWFCNGGFSTR